jgi:hypothetical protein
MGISLQELSVKEDKPKTAAVKKNKKSDAKETAKN